MIRSLSSVDLLVSFDMFLLVSPQDSDMLPLVPLVGAPHPGGGRAGGGGGAGGGGEGEGDLGEHPLEGGHVLHHLPGLLGLGPLGAPRALLPPDGHPAVLVDGELRDELLLLPEEPQLVVDLGLSFGELEADVDAVVGEVLAAGAGRPLAGQHAGRQGLPAAPRAQVGHSQDVGVVVLGDPVAVHHVGHLDLGARGLLDQPEVHLGEGLPLAPLDGGGVLAIDFWLRLRPN